MTTPKDTAYGRMRTTARNIRFNLDAADDMLVDIVLYTYNPNTVSALADVHISLYNALSDIDDGIDDAGKRHYSYLPMAETLARLHVDVSIHYGNVLALHNAKFTGGS